MREDWEPDEETGVPVSLPGLVPTGQVLVLHRSLSLLLCLSCVQGEPYLRCIAHLTEEEMRVLLPLLQTFPAYAPYAAVLASLEAISLEEAHQRVDRARMQTEERWTTLLHPLRAVVSGLRPKVHPCGLEIVAVWRRGYLLTRWNGTGPPHRSLSK